MKKNMVAIAGLFLLTSCGQNEPVPAPQLDPTPPPSSTAVNEPIPVDPSGGAYANDSGPLFVVPESQVERYSQKAQRGYSLLKFKCSQCHTTARPLNAQFMEVSAEKLAQLKKDRPELFSNKYLLQIETEAWKRKIKLMMSKPGAKISAEDAKFIYEFLLEYYQDKIGKNAEKADEWMAHRKKLLERFKKEYLERYQLLYGGQ